MEQYTELYKMGVLLTNNHFDPNYCKYSAVYDICSTVVDLLLLLLCACEWMTQREHSGINTRIQMKRKWQENRP